MSYKATWAKNNNIHEFEHIKLEKDGLEVIQTILDQYSKEGYSSITTDDMNRLKWAGLYEQKPRDGFFMMRVRVNSGKLNAKQVEVLAGIARDFAHGKVNITTRGAIQFHWIQIENVPFIYDRLKSCGLSTFEACGDCPRTIVGNPLAGVDKDELFDTTEIVEEVNSFFLLNKDFSNLPRKFKISISASVHNPAHAQINDIAFTPAVKNIDGNDLSGFHVWVGGGLSAKPILAQKLDVFVPQDDVLKVTKAVCTIFRDYGYREKRTHARLKFLVADWGIEKFQKKLFEYTGVMPNCGEDKVTDWNASYFYGIHPQRQSNKSYIGIHVPQGELTDYELFKLAEISKQYGDSSIRTTLTQNIIITGIDNSNVKTVIQSDIFERLSVQPNNITGYTVACTGKEFCNLAIVETKESSRQIIEYLSKNVELDKPIRIHFTGCPNSCGQKQIADISLQGAMLKTENGLQEAFTIWLGGSLNQLGTFAESLDYTVLSSDAHLVIERILYYYKSNQINNETFHEFVRRVGVKTIKSEL